MRSLTLSDKGVNIWDTFSHSVTSTTSGDDACKSYEFYKTDVQMLVQTGVTRTFELSALTSKIYETKNECIKHLLIPI